MRKECPRRPLLATAISALVAACAPADGDVASTAARTAEIVSGVEATDHPEACVISFHGSLCSGALVAPNVVLTAGHCVHGATSWTVTCPYASDRGAVRASQGAVAPTYPNLDDPDQPYIDNSQGSDVGLIRLDRALRETRVGRVRFTGVTTGTRVAALGRIVNGRTTSKMYRSPAFALTAHDRRNGYWVGVDRTVIESGDSGGPLLDVATGEIVAVNSAGIDPQYCRRGTVCDEWAVVGAARAWYDATLARFTGAAPPTPPPTTPPPTPPADPCATSTSCQTCTARASCGWCAGRCVTGTSSGGGACTRASGNWAWYRSQCP